MRADQVVANLQNSPLAFLQQYFLRIGGASNHGPSQFYSWGYDANQGGREEYKISAGSSNNNNGVAFHNFTAHNVKMLPPTAIYSGAFTYTLPAGGGSSLCLTGLLTGCTFGIHVFGNNDLELCHIQPVGIDGVALARTMSLIEVGGVPYWNVVYGRNRYAETNAVTILGSRGVNGWKFFAQVQDRYSRALLRVDEIL